MCSSLSAIRVLIADDSALMRRLVKKALEHDERICVIDEAKDGREALNKALLLEPNVLVLDVEMPAMDGLSVLREIMSSKPLPVVMFSSLTTRGAAITLEALSLGAVDFLAKPQSRSDISSVADELCAKVLTAAGANIKRVHRERHPRPKVPVANCDIADSLVVIGSSTGGPQALEEIAQGLEPDTRSAVVICQHMPAGFTASLARRLDKMCALSVSEGVSGTPLTRGKVLLVPGGRHGRIRLDSCGSPRLYVEDGPALHGVRPSVDVTLLDGAPLYGPSLMAVILSGMGFDGARGCRTAAKYGATVICQDQDSSVVWGMPRACLELTPKASVVELKSMPAVISNFGRLAERKVW